MLIKRNKLNILTDTTKFQIINDYTMKNIQEIMLAEYQLWQKEEIQISIFKVIKNYQNITL